jgi:hypothetical protein
MIFGKLLDYIGRRLVDYLTAPIPGFRPASTTDFDKLQRAMHTGDVLLVEGDTRIATGIKYLTQSTWSQSALYVGPIPDRNEPDGEPHVLVEALVEEGVISAPLSKYRDYHTRICRPLGLGEEDRRRVAAFAIERIGLQYDVKNIVDLARYLLPTPPVPSRFRRRLIALGSGEPTRAICSTLIAQAFQLVNYPILPRIRSVSDPDAPVQNPAATKEILEIRHNSLFAPRDFDISPYFAIVKPTIEAGFDFHKVAWAQPGNAAS